MRARASRPAELPELARRLRVAADHLVDVVHVDLAGAVPGNRPLDLLDELRKLGLVKVKTRSRAARRSAFVDPCTTDDRTPPVDPIDRCNPSAIPMTLPAPMARSQRRRVHKPDLPANRQDPRA